MIEVFQKKVRFGASGGSFASWYFTVRFESLSFKDALEGCNVMPTTVRVMGREYSDVVCRLMEPRYSPGIVLNGTETLADT